MSTQLERLSTVETEMGFVRPKLEEVHRLVTEIRNEQIADRATRTAERTTTLRHAGWAAAVATVLANGAAWIVTHAASLPRLG